MVAQTETQWILLGLGTLVFLAAALSMLTGEARHMLEYHFLMQKAMQMRNKYAEQILSLQPPKAASPKASPAASPPPSPTAGAAPVASDAATPASTETPTDTDFDATTLMPDATPSDASNLAA